MVEDRAFGGLQAAYHGVSAVVARLAEDDFFRVTRCQGWTVQDLLFHLLLDAQRALVTLASPTSAGPDTDHVSYWHDFAAGRQFEVDSVVSVRRGAAAYPSRELLASDWIRTSAAAVRAAERAPDVPVATQGKVLPLSDALRTFAVEAAIHHLDLIVDLPGAPPPDPAALRLVQVTLDGLLVEPFPIAWDDQTYILKATGRVALSPEERSALGGTAAQLPLLA